MGERCSFYLSLGLFSSFNIDSGTKLLLKTLAQQKAVPPEGRILDSGCGTGVIAVCLKKKYPEIDITASDRDALALRFTEKNAALNKLAHGSVKTVSGLLPGSMKSPLEGEINQYDLIISNIPAKAGNPVIRDFLQNCGMHLTETGFAAVVIVAPLADFARDCLIEAGAEIIYSESDKNYSVFHFTPRRDVETGSFVSVYERTDKRISGFFGLPEFDTVSYRTKVILEMLSSYSCSGRTLLWNPGIGHIAEKCETADHIITAGPDLLQLKATNYNIAAGQPYFHIGVFKNLPDVITEQQDCLIAAPDFITGAAIEEEVIETSRELLRDRGKLLVAGKSSDIARVEKSSRGFIIKHSIKYRGFRALLLEKQ